MSRNDLSNTQNDALTASILSRNGIETQLPFSRDVFLMSTRINGTMHVKNIYKLAKALKIGDRLTLRLETKNKYDEKAILVLDPMDKKLGYIPRVKNEALYHLMNAGKELFAIVHGGDIGENLDGDEPWISIFINVFMRD